MEIGKQQKIAYIGGGSRAWARKLMYDLALDGQLAGQVFLYDIDFEAAKDNEKLGNMITEHVDSKSHFVYNAVKTIDEALENADVVIISIMPATFDEMEIDVHTPEKYGIYQSVGDTAGFGGYLRAMKCAPMFHFFARKIKEICPKAFVINYTNPMTLCCRLMLSVYPDMKLIGCCHEVFSTQKLLARAYSDITGKPEPARQEIKIDVSGINHFTWVAAAEYDGEDLFPIFRLFADKYYEKGYSFQVGNDSEKNVMYCGNKIKFEMFRKYGVIPAAGDRHLAEFFPGKWYLENPERAHAAQFNLTPVSWRKENFLKKISDTKDIIKGIRPLTITRSGEEGVRQIKALCGLGDFVTNVNTSNIGQMEALPRGAVVETNAVLSYGKISPVKAIPLPAAVTAMIVQHAYRHEAFIEAVNKQNAYAVCDIIADDPQCGALNLDQVRELFDEMCNRQKKYLVPFWKF